MEIMDFIFCTGLGVALGWALTVGYYRWRLTPLRAFYKQYRDLISNNHNLHEKWLKKKALYFQLEDAKNKAEYGGVAVNMNDGLRNLDNEIVKTHSQESAILHAFYEAAKNKVLDENPFNRY